MKLGELVVVPLMEDAKSLAAFILSSADLSQSVTSAATALDRFLSPALLGLPVPPTPDSAPPSSPASGAFLFPLYFKRGAQVDVVVVVLQTRER
jgi:hypothetical protein